MADFGTAVFTTERLAVRPWTHTESDVAHILDTYSRPDVVRWLGGSTAIGSRDQAEALVDRWASRSDPDRSLGVWAVEVHDTGTVVGRVMLVALPDPEGTGDGEIEVGWTLHPDSWGHGYATEAARGAITRGFAGGLSEIYAVVRPGNERSVAVCRRLGMTPIGRTERWYDTELDAFRIDRGRA